MPDSHQIRLLENLVLRRDWQAVTRKCFELLAHDPNNFHLLEILATAYVGLGWKGNVEPCLQSLLRLGPNESSTHLFLSRYWMHRRKHDFAYWHARKALELEPEDAEASFVLGRVLLLKGKFKLALQMFSRARSLAPNETSYAAIELQLRSIIQTSVAERIRQKAEMVELLALDPNNAALLEMLGDFHAEQLGNAKRAIEFYKSALMSDPLNVDCQTKLVGQIPKQNVFTRTLFLPLSVFAWSRQMLVEGGWRVWLGCLIAFKGVLALVAWLFLMLALFAFPARCYELFFMADISVLSFKSKPVRKIMILLGKLPFGARIAIVAVLWSAFWIGVMGIFGVNALQAILGVATIYFCHLLIVSAITAFKRFEFWHEELQAGSSLKTQLKRLFLFFVANNTAMIAVAGAVILLDKTGWLIWSTAFAITLYGTIINALVLLKGLQFWISSISMLRPSLKSAELPPVGPPPPIPRSYSF